jgi:hypothetical protein
MKSGKIEFQAVLYLVSAIILLAGLGSAVLIYREAMSDPISGPDYEVIGGFVYPAGGENSKKYTHDLQLFGGNAAVLSDEFMRWFSGLWQGTSLAYTVAFITACISFVVFIIAKNLPTSCITDVRGEKDRDSVK